MKRQLISILLAALLLSGCASGRMGNPTAIGVGASVGGNIGGALGGIIGESSGGWRGGYRGSAIGTIVGTVAGAAIGHVMTAPKEERKEEGIYIPEVVERCPSEKEWKCDKKSSQTQRDVSQLKLRNLRFIDDNRNHVIDAGESCKILFEVINEGKRPAYNVIPIVETVERNKHIGISSTVMIEEILPGEGIRYTATIYGKKKLKNGEVLFRVAIAEESGMICDFQEFLLSTRSR